MLIRLLRAHEMTKHVCKISRLISKRLLRKLQKNIRGLFYFAAPCTLSIILNVMISCAGIAVVTILNFLKLCLYNVVLICCVLLSV